MNNLDKTKALIESFSQKNTPLARKISEKLNQQLNDCLDLSWVNKDELQNYVFYASDVLLEICNEEDIDFDCNEFRYLQNEVVDVVSTTLNLN